MKTKNIENKINELRGFCETCESNPEVYEEVKDLFYSSIQSLYREIDRLWDSFYKHKENHLPSPKSVEQLNRAIKALGLEEEYMVEKRTIYANNGQPNKILLEIDLKKNEA